MGARLAKTSVLAPWGEVRYQDSADSLSDNDGMAAQRADMHMNGRAPIFSAYA